MVRTILTKIWKIWADALGAKADEYNNRHSDYVAIVRTVILLIYIITNLTIIMGIIKHWKD